MQPEDSVAGRCHFSRSACQGHGRHEDRQEGEPEAAGRESRRSQARRRCRRQDHRESACCDRDRAGAAAQGRGKAGREETRPAEGRREKPKEEPKQEPKPAEKKPDPVKPDPIAEAIKKEEKKPPPKPVQAAKPPEPPKQRIVERHFDQTQIAALLDKRDPSRQATTGDTLNSNAALGLAKGAAANNSATWGAMFRQQVCAAGRSRMAASRRRGSRSNSHIKLKQDGSLKAMPVAVTSPSSAFQRVFLESGLRAIIECAPYRLPPAFFAEWQAFIPVFDNKDR